MKRIVLIALAVMARPGAARDKPLHMRIVVPDHAGLSPAVIRQAETVVTGIYSRIGIEIAWRDIVGFEDTTAIDQAAVVSDGQSASTLPCSRPLWNIWLGPTGARLEWPAQVRALCGYSSVVWSTWAAAARRT